MEFSQLQFIRPYFLLLIPVGIIIAWYLLRSSSQKDSWEKICDPHLLSAIKTTESQEGSHWPKLLFPILFIASLALSGPAFRSAETPLIKSQSALVIALDVSKSMMAEDIKPNRLERAKFKINDILDQRKDGQTALIVYSGDAFVVTPLSDDVETIKLMLKSLSPKIMPLQGSREDRALVKAQELIKQANHLTGQILLVTDGIKLNKSESIVTGLANDKIFTSVLAIGTEQGSPIPDEYGFVKNNQGQIITTKLETSQFSQLASLGKGKFAVISGNSQDIESLNLNIIDETDNKLETDESSEKKLIDEGPFIALLLIPLFLLLMRKGLLLSFFLVISINSPQPSYAFEWSDLWLNNNQKAAKNIKEKQFEKAFNQAKNDQWKASAAYKQKQYKNASELFNGNSAEDHYNKGNSLAQMGQLEKALESYEQSLSIRPEDEDTLYNKKIVEEALKQQQEQEQNQQDQENSDSEENQENSDDQQSDSSDQQEQNQDSDQQNSDQEQKEGENKSEQEQEEQQGEQNQQELTEEEKQQLKEQQEALEKADQDAEKQEQEVQISPEELATEAEKKEAIEQWLRRIPDDPGGLLRRKFYYQYSRDNDKPNEAEDW